MTSSMNLDPFEVWRQAINRLESGLNSIGNQSLSSKKITEILHQLSATSLQRQQIVDRAITKYLKAVNLPSREDLQKLSDSLSRIEEMLERLVPAPLEPQARLQPARTRRPASIIAPTSDPASVAPAAVPKRRQVANAQRRKRKGV